MKRFLWLSILALGTLLAMISDASAAGARSAHIAYVYPAGGQQGTTIQLKLGGRRLNDLRGVIVSGTGVQGKIYDYLEEIKGWQIEPITRQLALLREEAAEKEKVNKKLDEVSQRILDTLERRMRERLPRPGPACDVHREVAIIQLTIAPDAEPGPREIRLITKAHVSNPLPFHIGQLPEVARKPMITSILQELGNEQHSMRNRPDDEVEARITPPCTMNGQVGSGEVNRYRFQARGGQRLVISTAARQLIPYISDAVPGWFQPVLRVFDADGRELAFNDDYRFKPDPTLCFEVPEDGEYVLEISDALYRGRVDFIYRVTIGELPFMTGIFPLGSRVGEPATIEMTGWNLDKAKLIPPPQTVEPGVYRVVADSQGSLSNSLPFALDTLPECFDQESNNDPSIAQKVTLPTIINGRMDHSNDWDVFQFEGQAGDTIVAEVTARRLDSPMDSLLKLTDATGKVVAINDDWEDLTSGLNTHHADSYMMVKLPTDGPYYVHLGETLREGGKEYAYRLRISRPRPSFELRVVPSWSTLHPRGRLAVYAFRKDGFTGDIQLSLKDVPEGVSAKPVSIPAGTNMAEVRVQNKLKRLEKPINLYIEGHAKVQDHDIVRRAVPAEDWMQAFEWVHLVPTQELTVCLPSSFETPPKRVPPELDPEAKLHEPLPKSRIRTSNKRSLRDRMEVVDSYYEQWLLTDEFYHRYMGECRFWLPKAFDD